MTPAAMQPEGRKKTLQAFLEELQASGGITGGVGLVGTSSEVLVALPIGRAQEDPPALVTPGTFFDLASLTKPVVATLAVVLDATGDLPLDAPVGEVFPEAHRRLARRELGQLLRHRSGLAPWTPLFARVGSREEALRLLLGGELLSAEGETYSDLGYILWEFAAEDRLGSSLAQLLGERVFPPLSIVNMAPSPGPRPDVARCRLTNDREVELARAQGIEVLVLREPPHGTVQDGNSRFLGGLTGAAGLFATANAIWKLAREWLAPGALLDPDKVRSALEGGERYALGWWWRRMRGHAGSALTSDAFGMVGFTGGSCWVDPARDLVAILLTHRLSWHFDLAPWRRRFHRVAVEMVRDEGAAAVQGRR
ncbi:MAG TPA: serine hydrolase domain-containing protein [Thermoanaerobaculia bacterium]|nr:serine hydrolase domain-containing protein [Thermoanaerobaculia bacterium]